jgi:putative oxidoreductase
MTDHLHHARTRRSPRLAGPRSIVATLLGCIFLAAGISKLIALDSVVETFQGWGFPAWFRWLIGLVEMLAAVLVLIPATRELGAGLIALVMLGAVGTHVLAREWSMEPLPLALLVLAVMLVSVLRPRLLSDGNGSGRSLHAR